MDATSGAAAVWWWIGIAALYLVVIPVILFLAHRLLRFVLEIKRYAGDVMEHGGGITGNLEPVPELNQTRELVKRIGPAVERYSRAVGSRL